MIEFVTLSTFSFISILSLGKIINYNSRFNYFIAIILLTLISLICLGSQLNFLLILIKIFLVTIFFYLLIKKKIRIEKFDYVYLITFIFLLYFNFNDFFSKTDVLGGYGYQIKVIFLNSKLPHLDQMTNFNYGGLGIIQGVYFNYFISGLFNFREDTIILSQNLFMIICFATVLKPSDLKNWNKILQVIIVFAIFYFLTTIFLQNGKNILAEDFMILFIFALTIFIIEHKDKINFKSFTFLIICFFLLGLGKKTTLFLLLFPLGILIFNNDNSKKKFINFIVLTLILIFSINFSFNLDSKLVNNIQNKPWHKIHFHEAYIKNLKNKSNDLSFERKSDDIFIEGNLLPSLTVISPKLTVFNNYYQKSYIRYKAFKSNKDIFLNNLYNTVISNIIDIEIYKASLLPPIRFIVNRLNLDYKFPRLSIILYYWIIFIFFLYFYIFINLKNFQKKRESFYKFSFLTTLIIFINVLLVFEDLLRHAEIINLKEKIFSFKLDPTDRDSSRYLGWSIMFSILCSIYLAKKTISLKFSKFINIILITLMLVVPARGYAHLFKVHKEKKAHFNLKKNYIQFSSKLRKSCDENLPIIIFDDDYSKHNFTQFMYEFYDYQFMQFHINKNDKEIFENFYKKDLFENLNCLIVNDNLPVKLIIDRQTSYKSFKITANNDKFLDYTLYLLKK